MNAYDYLVVGAGVFGITTAVELARRKYKVGLLNPDTIPHHLAASTDVTKAVRVEYGSDQEYFRMAEICIDKWLEWNDLFNESIFHQIGYLMLCRHDMLGDNQSYEKYSFDNLMKSGYPSDRLNSSDIEKRFPAVNHHVYVDGHFNAKGGYVRSGRAIEILMGYAIDLGVEIHQQQTVDELTIESGVVKGVTTREGGNYSCGHLIVAAGANTPYLISDLQPYMKVTGHPVFWVRPKDPTFLVPPYMGVFTADISNTGWYGFPYLRDQGIFKIAKHTNGLSLHPESDDRQVTDDEVKGMRAFLEQSFPTIADSPLVYTRRCLYTDTLDGHFWIDNHPEIRQLTVSTGGSGHGMKMGPVLGEMTADVAEGKTHEFSGRYRWRHLTEDTIQAEEARHVIDRKL